MYPFNTKTVMKNLRKEVRELLAQNNYMCNADGRNFVADNISSFPKREISGHFYDEFFWYAEEIGGCKPGEEFSYPNAQGTTSVAKVTSLYDLPEGMVNPHLVVFSGMMTAHLYAMEVIRSYAKQTNSLIPVVAIGDGGNKGLYENVFNREEGVMITAEYEAYLNCLSLMAPESYVRANQRVCKDRTTHGNFDEMYNFAKAKGLEEATFVLCSGNFSYDKRLLAEGMLQLKDEKYSDVKINLVLAHCPIKLDLNVPEGHISEILLGYVAASLGPLMKDTIPFGSDAAGERYLMPGVKEADWKIFEELITDFSNMGWPNYQELLYGVNHEEAVENIILSDLYARGSFTAEDYDKAILKDIFEYQCMMDVWYSDQDFLEYLKGTPDMKYF